MKKYLWWIISIIVAIALGVTLYIVEDTPKRGVGKVIARPDVVQVTGIGQNLQDTQTIEGQMALGTQPTQAGQAATGTQPVQAGQTVTGAQPVQAGQTVTGAQPVQNGQPTGMQISQYPQYAGVQSPTGQTAPAIPPVVIRPTSLQHPRVVTPTPVKGTVDSTQIHPVLDESYRIIGGTIAGKWASREDLAKNIHGNEKFKVYSQSRLLGLVTSVKPEGEHYIAGNTGYYVNMVKDRGFSGDIFSIATDWNPLPRIPRYETSFEKYLPLIQNRLYEKALYYTKAMVKSVIALDLEGDGVEEYFIIATNITRAEVSSMYNATFTDPGDKYCILLMQKITKGKEENFVLFESYQQLWAYDIAFFADVDKDGTMEFVATGENLSGLLVEGIPFTGKELFDMNKGKPELISSGGKNSR